MFAKLIDWKKIIPRCKWIVCEQLLPIILSYTEGNCLVVIGQGIHSGHEWIRTSDEVFASWAQYFNLDLYSCDVKPERAVKLFDKHYTYCGTSEKFMEWWKENNKDKIPNAVHIDGLHNAKTVMKEFEFFFERLAVGGVIFMHDTWPPNKRYAEQDRCGGVYKVRRILEEDMWDLGSYNVFTWPYSGGKRGEHLGVTMVIKHDPERNEERT